MPRKPRAPQGSSETLIKMLLPFIASMLMSALQRYLQGGLGDILKRLPQGSGQSQTEDEDDERPAPQRRGRSDDDSDERGGGYGRGFELPQQGPIDGIPDRGPIAERAHADGSPRAPRETPRDDSPWQSPSARVLFAGIVSAANAADVARRFSGQLAAAHPSMTFPTFCAAAPAPRSTANPSSAAFAT